MDTLATVAACLDNLVILTTSHNAELIDIFACCSQQYALPNIVDCQN